MGVFYNRESLETGRKSEWGREKERGSESHGKDERTENGTQKTVESSRVESLGDMFCLFGRFPKFIDLIYNSRKLYPRLIGQCRREIHSARSPYRDIYNVIMATRNSAT